MAEKLEWNHFIGTISEYLGVEKEELKKETHIYDDLGIDSLGLFSVGMNIIKTYNVRLPLSVVSTVTTIGSLYEALEVNNSQTATNQE
jgi:acyl carrier protein